MHHHQHNISSSLDSHNGSEIQQHCEPLGSVPLMITAGLVASGVIIGNSLVIIAIIGGSSKFFRPMYWFILHLSFSDLLLGVMLLWNYCLAEIFSISNTLTSLTVIHGVWVTSACTSVLGILFLAIDRYMQVVHRRLHKLYFNQCSVGFSIFFAWLIPIIVFLISPTALNWSCKQSCSCYEDRYIECTPINECSQIIPPFTKSCILVVAIYLCIIMPLPILVYSLIFIKARKSTQNVRQKMRHRDMRLIRTLVVIMLAFVITVTPAIIVMAIDYFNKDHNSKLVDYALYVFVVGTLNSLANPILYIWRIPAIRVSLERRFSCHKNKSHGVSRTSHAGNRFLENFHSDQPSGDLFHHSPVNQKTSQSLFCTKRCTINFSDASQNSTPLFQRSVGKKINKKLGNNQSEIIEMQKLHGKNHLLIPHSSVHAEARIENLQNNRHGNAVERNTTGSTKDEQSDVCTVMIHSKTIQPVPGMSIVNTLKNRFNS